MIKMITISKKSNGSIVCEAVDEFYKEKDCDEKNLRDNIQKFIKDMDNGNSIFIRNKIYKIYSYANMNIVYSIVAHESIPLKENILLLCEIDKKFTEKLKEKFGMNSDIYLKFESAEYFKEFEEYIKDKIKNFIIEQTEKIYEYFKSLRIEADKWKIHQINSENCKLYEENNTHLEYIDNVGELCEDFSKEINKIISKILREYHMTIYLLMGIIFVFAILLLLLSLFQKQIDIITYPIKYKIEKQINNIIDFMNNLIKKLEK